jgi:hypothetical protein
MEAPLLPPTPVARKPPKQVEIGGKDVVSGTVALLGAAKVAGLTADMAGNVIINGATNPASLQAVVKITGSNLSLHHRVSDNYSPNIIAACRLQNVLSNWDRKHAIAKQILAMFNADFFFN